LIRLFIAVLHAALSTVALNTSLFGNNIAQQETTLVRGALYPTPSGIIEAETFQGGSRGGHLGFVGANAAPAALFASNMFYGSKSRSHRKRKSHRRR